MSYSIKTTISDTSIIAASFASQQHEYAQKRIDVLAGRRQLGLWTREADGKRRRQVGPEPSGSREVPDRTPRNQLDGGRHREPRDARLLARPTAFQPAQLLHHNRALFSSGEARKQEEVPGEAGWVPTTTTGTGMEIVVGKADNNALKKFWGVFDVLECAFAAAAALILIPFVWVRRNSFFFFSTQKFFKIAFLRFSLINNFFK